MSQRDWPHDPDGEEGSEGMRKYGHAVVAKKVDEDEDFPLDAADLVADHGDDPVRIDFETVVALEEIADHLDQEEFEDIVDMHRAFGRAMREGGYWTYEGADAFARS